MQKGFTIIEIIIVIAIIGVIAAIAIPAYNGYTVRTNRTAVQTEMMRISQELQRYQVTNRNSFNGATLARVQSSGNFPETNPHYRLALSDVGNNSWTLTATPASPQQTGDGVVRLNHRGHKCWTKGANTCTLSNSSNWDNK